MRTLFIVILFFTVPAVTGLVEVQPGDDVRSAVSGLGPGDTLLMAGGQYDLETIRIENKGSPDNPVVIMAKPGETPIITGTSSSHNLISVRSAEHVVIDGLVIDGTADGSDPLKFESGQNSSYMTIQNCEIKNYLGVGINSKGNDHHITVRGCHIYNSIGGHGEGFYIGDHNGAVNPHHWLIENNWVHDTRGGPDVGQGDGIELKWGCYAMTVRNNVVYNTNYPGILYYGYNGTISGDSMMTIIEGNVVWGTGEAIGCYADVIVRNNIVFNGSLISMYYSGHKDPENVLIYNNTFYDCNTIRLNPWDEARNCVFANNAAYSSGLNLSSSGTLYGNVGDISHSSFSPGTAAADLSDAAAYDFYPTAGSALIGAATGEHIALTDFNGTARGAAPDVGAYQRTAESNPGWAITEGFKSAVSIADRSAAPVRLSIPAGGITGGRAVITISLPSAGAFQLDIHDLSGKRLWTGSSQGSAGAQQVSFEIKDRKPAALVYIAVLTQNRTRAVKPIPVRE
jgi:hypothetical protein